MNSTTKMAALALVLCSSATGAAAQAKECDAPVNSPKQVATALVFVSRGGSDQDRAKSYRTAVKQLTDPGAKIDNEVGRSYVLARALSGIAAIPGQAHVTTRGAVGFVSSPEGQIDLLAAADSLFSIVEKASPNCVDEVQAYRELVANPIYSAAVAAYRTGNMDSATKAINRMLVVYPRSSDAHNVLGIISQQKEDYATAAKHFQKVVEFSGTDTASLRLKRGAQGTLADLTSALAVRASGDEAKRLWNEASGYYREFLKDDPTNTQAQAGLARALAATGDTAAAGKVFSQMVANAANFNETQLFTAGVMASQVERVADAALFFEHALRKNAFSRDALFNLAIMYAQMDSNMKVIPVAMRLVEVDPNNPDNWRFLARSYVDMQKTTKDAALKKAWTDSAVKYLQKSASLPAVVRFSTFSHDGSKHTLAGTIENPVPDTATLAAMAPQPAAPKPTRCAKPPCPAPKPAAAAPGPVIPAAEPRTYTLKFEFLDNTGKVVASQEATVGPVQPGESKTFSVTVEQPGIVAYRYAPIT